MTAATLPPPGLARAAPPQAAAAEKVSFSRILKFSWQLIKTCPGAVALYVVLTFVTQSAIPQAIALVYGGITDAITFSSNPHAPVMSGRGLSLAGLFWLWITLTLAALAFSVANRAVAAAMDGRMKIFVRSQLFSAVLRQPPGFYQENDAGRLNLLLNSLGVQSQQAIRSLVIDPTLQIFGIITASVLIGIQLKALGPIGWGVLAVALVIGGIPTFLISRKGRIPVERVNRENQNKRLSLGTLENGVVSSPAEVQIFGAEPFFAEKQDQGLQDLRRLDIKQATVMELVNVGLQVPAKAALAAVIFVALFYAARINGKPGTFVSLLALVPQITDPLRGFASIGILASASWPAITAVLRLLGTGGPESNGKAEIVDNNVTELQAKNLQFRYGPNSPNVFNNLNLSIPAGSITGIAARIGQGKSTFFRLIMRFYDPDSGEILLGGASTRDLPVSAVRRHVSMMSQAPAFYQDTVAENLRMANTAASPAQLKQACELTGIWPILEKSIGTDPLDKPFATGKKLSGGQQKLFALTRCLLRQPKVLLLDEPTTGMDNLEKFPLIPMIRKACAGKTVIVVDHDLPWLARFCDRIIVFDGGRVVEEGSPAELLAKDGLFREIHDAANDKLQNHEPAKTQ